MIKPLPHPSTSAPDTTLQWAYCDLCGAPEHDATGKLDPDAIGWSADENRIAETHLSCCQGTWERADGSAGRVKRLEFHLCPRCFLHALVPWFRQHGAVPSVWRHDSDDSP